GRAKDAPVLEAKKLCARHVRFGDIVRFPVATAAPGLDVVVAQGEGGRRSALIVHRNDVKAAYAVDELTGEAAEYEVFLKLDRGTGGRVSGGRFDGCARFEGYGVAVAASGGGAGGARAGPARGGAAARTEGRRGRPHPPRP